MAEAVGMGFDISGLDKAIQNANKSLDDLVKKSNDTQKAIVKDFQTIANDGVGVFIKKINEAQKALSKIGGKDALSSIESSTKKAVDNVNRFSVLMSKINNDGASGRRSSAVTKINEELDVAKKRLEELQNLLKFYTKGEGKKAIGFVDTAATQQEAKNLMNQIDLLERQKASLQANERLRLAIRQRQTSRDNNYAQMEANRRERLKSEQKKTNDAVKASTKEYANAARERQEIERMYHEMGIKLRSEHRVAMGREYELEQEQEKKNLANFAKYQEDMRKWSESRVSKQDKSKQAEGEALQKEFQEALKLQKKREELIAASEDAKRKARNKQIQSTAKTAFNIDAIEERERKASEAKAERERKASEAKAERERKASEAKAERERKAEEKRYNDWQKQKEKEVREQEKAEQQKTKAVQLAIEQQNKAYAEAAIKRAKQDSEQRKKAYTQYTTSYEGALKTSNRANTIEKEIQAVKNLESARKKLNTSDANYAAKLNTLNEAIQRHKKNIEEASKTDKQRAEEAQRNVEKIIQSEKRAYEERAKLYRQQNQKKNQTYEGALAFSSSANTINRQILAIKNLEAARNSLSKTDADYANKLRNLNDRIREHKKNIDNATNSSQNMQQSHRNLMDTAGQFQRKLALVFSVSQISGYINKIVQVRGEFELQQKALQAIVQNVDEANKLWDKTVALAIQSPFRVKELVTYTKQLAAYRIETSQLYDTTKRLADVSAGLGVDMQRLILAYGQVRAANFLRGTELRQFTEAGIPMLEELAKHFSELEGRAISVGDVFERISKRMVIFQDVAAVFQRMTDEGGVFYDMQVKQSETLKGQISNLHDAIDLMMNDIGKANDGVLKDTVSVLRQLVDNWRAFATVLKQISAAIILLQLSRFASGWSLVATEGAAAAMAMNGTAGAAARLRVGLKSLFATIKAHPILLIVGALISAGHALWNYIDAINAANEKYNEMSRREMRRAKTLSDLNDKVLQNNKVIKDNNKKVEEQNDAIKENNEILIKIKKEYPDLYNAVVKQADGTIDLTEAIKLQNEELRANIALRQQAKGDFWQKSQSENYEEAVNAQKKYASSIEDLKSKAIDLGYQLEYAFSKGQISEESYNRLKEYLEIISKTGDLSKISEERAVKITSPYGPAITRTMTYQKRPIETLVGSEEDREIINRFYKELGVVINKAGRANIDYSNSLNDLWDTFKNQIPTFSTELNKTTNAEDRGKWLKEQLNTLLIIDEKIQEWARTKLIKELEINIIFPQNNNNNKGELDEWAKRVKAAIEEVNKKIKEANPEMADNLLFPIPEVGQTKEQYLNAIKPALEAAKAIYREGQKIEDESEIERTNALKPYADAVERILNIQEKGKKEENDALQRLKEQIRLIREASKAYEDMLKLHGKAYADENINKAYKTPFKEAGLEDISQYTFGTKQNELDNLNKLGDTAKRVSGGMLELSKATAQVQSNLDDFNAEKANKELIDQIDNMFGNYEVSLELEKLNIPTDLAKRLFGIDAIDLSAIRKEIEKELEIVRATGGRKDQEKELEERLKKVEELEEKELKERLKRYSQFLVKGQSEAVRLKIEELRELAKLEEDYQNKRIEKTDYELAKKGIQDEYKRKQDDLVWDEFTESDTYIRMFEDLDKVSTSSIRKMIKKLEDLKGSLSDLDTKNVKELIEALEKLKDEDLERNPFRAMSENAKEWVQWLTQAVSLNKELKDAESREEEAKQALSYSEDNYSKAQEDYERVSKDKNATGEQKNAAKASLDMYKAAYQSAEGVAESAKETADEARKTKEELKEAALLFAEGLGGAADEVKQYTDAISELAGHFNGDLAESISGVGGGISSLLGGAGSLASGIASGNPLAMIQGASSIIGGITALHDEKKEREIKKQQKLVENLGRQYEDLEKKIENAYNIGTYQQAVGESKENLEEQIAAYDRMIEAEEAKKKTDKDRIQEWRDEQKDLLNQIEELEAEAFSEASGGIIDDARSAAREFVDAWYEAFLETGDGLDGLTEHFKDNLLEMVKQQAALQIAGVFTDKWQKELQKYINDEDMTLTTDEAERWYNSINKDLPELSDALTEFFNAMGSATEGAVSGAGELSGLTESIQGMSESTAEELAAYLNSIRFLVSQINDKMGESTSSALAFATRTETDANSNPMLSELRTQTALISSINEMFGSVIGRGQSKSHTGAYLKVSI